MKIATGYVELRADRTRMKRDLDDVEQDVRKKAESTSKLFAQIFGVAAFAKVVKGSIDAASDLNETISKTRQLFGEDADAVIAFSKTTAQAMGLSQRSYLDAAAGLKGLLDNLGLAPAQATEWSQKLTQLGSDLGSFFNKDPAEAVLAIGSAMRGESEPIRAFNVQINEAAIKTKALELGLYDGKGAIDSNAKAQATLALIMEQTTAAQGDFARTADGAANKQRILKATTEDSAASLGQALLPIYTRVVQLVTTLAEGFGALPAPVQMGVVALAGIVALAGPIHTVVEMSQSLITSMGGVGKAAQKAAVAVGVVTLAMTVYALIQDRISGQNRELAEALNDVARGQGDVADSTILVIAKMLELKGAMPAEVAARFAKENLGAVIAMRDLALTSAETRAKLEEQGLTIDVLNTAIDAETKAQQNVTEATAKATEATAAGVAPTVDLTGAVDALIAAVKKVEQAEKDNRDAIADGIQAQRDMNQARKDALGNIGDLEQSLRDLDSAYFDLQQQLLANIQTQDDQTLSQGEKDQSNRDLLTSEHNLAEKVAETAAKYAEENGAVEGTKRQTDLMRDSLELSKAKYPELAAEIQKYIDALLSIPSSVNTVIRALPSINGLARTAEGGYFNREQIRSISEGGAGEAVLPLTKPFRLAALLADPRIGGPIAAAMGSGGSGGQGGGYGAVSSGRPVPSITVNNYRRDIGVGDLNQVLAMARLS